MRLTGVQLHRYPGAPHAFNVIFAPTKIAQKWNAEFKEGVRWLLAQTAGGSKA